MRQFFLSIRGFWPIIAALSFVFLVTGCGDSDDSATGSPDSSEVIIETGSLSKAEFLKQANALCQETREQDERELGAYLRKQSADPTAASEGTPEIEFVEDTIVPNMQEQVDKIAALGAPRGDEEKLSAFLSSLQQIINEAKEDPAAFIRTESSFREAPKLAKAYGLSGCAVLI